MAEKFYVTTAIDYVNAAPHIGHAYQKIVADALSRWNKLQGKEVLFVTGTDEHGKKVEEAANAAGKNPKEFVDEIVEEFKSAWKALSIDYDRFIRTTDEDHKLVVEDFIKKCNDAGDIYKGNYEGLYCTGCENYITEKDLVDGNCPLHGKPPEKITEETYFFRLSKYKDFLLNLYKTDFCQPKIRRNEVEARVKEGLKDLSISRTSFSWGIPFPLDEKHITYVWFDALINYYTATQEKNRQDFWGSPTVHILGKDNTWFHNVYWPAMLESAGLPLPKTTLNHGFLTFNGQKISKSLGNAISPVTLVEKYGADTVRYFCLRQFPFATGSDGDFDEEALVDRHNNELANKLGNLVSRTSSLAEKYGIEKSDELLKKLDEQKINSLMENYEVDKALNEIFAFIDICNEYVQDKKPWETQEKKVLGELVVAIRKIAELLSPFIPENAAKISVIFSGNKIKKAPVLFQKIEYTPKLIDKPNLNKTASPKEIMENVTTIQYADFEKMKIIVAEVLEATDIEGADKLYKLKLNAGSEERTICAGIKPYYDKEDLIGKKIIYLSNLAPRKMKGIESQGMLLAASNVDHSRVSLLMPDQDMEPGCVVG